MEVRSTFLATRNATIALAKWGVTSDFFLATLRCKLQEKMLRVTWPLETAGARTGIDTYSLLFYCTILVREVTWDSYLFNIDMFVRVYSYTETAQKELT